MSLAVAKTNTGACFSCIQVRKVASTRLAVPLSPPEAGEGFLDFVHPEHAGGDDLGDLHGLADVFLRRAQDAAEHRAHVQAQQGQLPHAGRHLGAQALAGAGNADQRHAPGQIQAVFPGFLAEGQPALVQPGLEGFQAAHPVGLFHIGVQLQGAALPNDRPLLLGDQVDAALVELAAAAADHGLLEHPPGLGAGEPQGGLDQLGAQGGLHAPQGPGGADGAFEQGVHFPGVGFGQLQHRHVVLQFRGQAVLGRGDDDVFARRALGQDGGQIAQTAQDSPLDLPDLVEILEDEGGAASVVAEHPQNGVRGGLPFVVEVHPGRLEAGELVGDVPGVKALAVGPARPLGQGGDFLEDARFFAGDHVDHGDAGVEEQFKVILKGHG